MDDLTVVDFVIGAWAFLLMVGVAQLERALNGIREHVISMRSDLRSVARDVSQLRQKVETIELRGSQKR